MSTRAVIARLVDDDHWDGTYVRWDGYPQATGKHLHRQINGILWAGGDLADACRELITEHPTGWAEIGPTSQANQCYCHDRGEGVRRPAWGDWIDYFYLIDEPGLRIHHSLYGLIATARWDAEVDWEAIERRTRRGGR